MRLSSALLAMAALAWIGACADTEQYLGDDRAPSSPCDEDCSTIAVATCQQAVCDPSTRRCKVVIAAEDTPCDDGLFCTVDEVCKSGICGGGKPNSCGSSDCKLGICNEEENTCVTTLQADDTPCAVTGDLCQVGARCKAGECLGTPKNCSLAPGMDDCHVAYCNSDTGACTVVVGNDGARCEDDACGLYKTCRDGVCQGGINRSTWTYSTDPASCKMSVCDPATGVLSPKTVAIGDACGYSSDGSGFECTTGECAGGGRCLRIPKQGTACNAVRDECNLGVCNADGFCSAIAAHDGIACDDRNLCTEAETCNGGTCSGRLKPGTIVYFSDNFEEGNKGWSGPADTQWTIRSPWQLELQLVVLGGPGLVGNRNPQPEVDHTPTMGNVFLASNGVKPSDYFESPTIDLSQATDEVWLTTWRAITIPAEVLLELQVYDGSSWVPVWSTPAATEVLEWTWRPIALDVTKYKNPNFKIRFHTESPPSITAFGWLIDDVFVTNRPCAVSEDPTTGGGP